MRWRLELRRWTSVSLSLLQQQRVFDHVYAKMLDEQGGVESFESKSVLLWFGAHAVITLRRFADEQHPSLTLTLSRIAKRPDDALSFDGRQIDMIRLSDDRDRLRQSLVKINEVGHNELAHDKRDVQIELRPQYHEIRTAIACAFDTATYYDASFSALTMQVQDDGSAFPTVLATIPFEDLGETARWVPLADGSDLHNAT